MRAHHFRGIAAVAMTLLLGIATLAQDVAEIADVRSYICHTGERIGIQTDHFYEYFGEVELCSKNDFVLETGRRQRRLRFDEVRAVLDASDGHQVARVNGHVSDHQKRVLTILLLAGFLCRIFGPFGG
jgi:hypothetical protein